MNGHDEMKITSFWSRKLLGKYLKKFIRNKFGITTNVDINTIDLSVSDKVYASVDAKITMSKKDFSNLIGVPMNEEDLK